MPPVFIELILAYKSFMHPQEFLVLVHHTHETAKAGISLFKEHVTRVKSRLDRG